MLNFHRECWNPVKKHSKAFVFFAVSKQIPIVYSAGRGRAEMTRLSKDFGNGNLQLISSHLSHLTLEVVGSPQMTLQQYLPPFPVFRCPQGISQSHSRPFLDVIFPSLLLSSSPSCSFHCPLQNCLRHARGS